MTGATTGSGIHSIVRRHDWAADVKRYVPNADDAAINGIIKHLGIALQSQDASLVACNDKTERDRVRDSFLNKKTWG